MRGRQAKATKTLLLIFLVAAGMGSAGGEDGNRDALLSAGSEWIEEEASMENTVITHMTASDNTTRISPEFAGCKRLEQVEIPQSAGRIADHTDTRMVSIRTNDGDYPLAMVPEIDRLIADRSTAGNPPSENGNETAIAFLPNIEQIRFPEALILSSSGRFPDGRAYRKYYFHDSCVINNNMCISSGDLTQRYLVSVGNSETEEMYLLFAKAKNHDEIYRKVELSRDDTGYLLKYSGGTSTVLATNTMTSSAKNCSNRDEAAVSSFLYWDCSRGGFLTTREWEQAIHFRERYEANDEASLPKNVRDALAAGFIKLPSGDSVYHQMYSGLGEYEQGACLKLVTHEGREAVYQILTNTGDYDVIKTDPNATELIMLSQYPEIGPTYNYSTGDWAEQKSIGYLNSYVTAKLSVNSIAHYYFDMLPYYWWGNGTPGDWDREG